jgi:Arc/MetJ-type ribon-helix-helix transcriptional regulator
MAHEEAARQFSFRLPEQLVERVESCMTELRASGLEVTRADVVRLLLKHALDATHCRIELLLGNAASKKGARRRDR